MAALNSRLRADLGIALTVRIGVNSGEVAAGDIAAGHGMVAGDAVNTAARLQSAAPPGEILIGPHTRSLVGRAVRLRTHPPAELPGKRRPLRVWQVVELDRRVAVSSAPATCRWWDGEPSCECSAAA